MFWLLGLLVFVLLLVTWLLLSEIELKLDTRILQAELGWKTIGWVRVWHDQEWLIRFRIFFFSKKLPISGMKRTRRQPKKARKENKTTHSSSFKNIPGRMINVIRSFDVLECNLAIDTGDHSWNARLYPLNYVPFARGHLFINFLNENFLVLKIRNRPWKILYAFFRKSFV